MGGGCLSLSELGAGFDTYIWEMIIFVVGIRG